MSLKRYLIIMGMGTIIALASWVLVVMFLDPQNSGVIGLILFFVSFFLGMFGLASVVGYLIRRFFQHHETPFRLVAISFRQAGLLAVLLTGSLILQSQRLFTWWTALLLLLFLTLLEAFFIARMSSRQSPTGGSHGT